MKAISILFAIFLSLILTPSFLNSEATAYMIYPDWVLQVQDWYSQELLTEDEYFEVLGYLYCNEILLDDAPQNRECSTLTKEKYPIPKETVSSDIGVGEVNAPIMKSIIIQTDKSSYSSDEIITITGNVSQLAEYAQSVTVVITSPDGNIGSIIQVIPGSDGNFSTTLKAGGTMTVSGDYEMSAQYGAQKISSSFGFTADVIPDLPIPEPEKESLRSKLQNAGSYEKQRHIILEFVDSYKIPNYETTLGDALVVYLLDYLTSNPNSVWFFEQIHDSNEKYSTSNKNLSNFYEVGFITGGAEKILTIDLRDEKIEEWWPKKLIRQYQAYENSVTNEKITGNEDDITLRHYQRISSLMTDEVRDKTVEEFLLEYYMNDKFPNLSESQIISKLESERTIYSDKQKSPQNFWWTGIGGGSLSQVDYEINFRESMRTYPGTIMDANLTPDGTWTWKVEKPDSAIAFNSDGTKQLDTDGSPKFKDVTATAEVILKPNGSGSFTLTYSYAHVGIKTEGIMNADGSWVLTSHTGDGQILKASGSDDDWTGILKRHNAYFEKRSMNSDGTFTYISYDHPIQKTCTSSIDNSGSKCVEEDMMVIHPNGDWCTKDIAIFKSQDTPIC